MYAFREKTKLTQITVGYSDKIECTSFNNVGAISALVRSGN